MIHIYDIHGMTCSSCVNKVKAALLAHPDVVAAEVQLAAPHGRVTFRQHVSLTALQAAVSGAGGTQISEHVAAQPEAPGEIPSGGKLRVYKPLILVVAYITITALAATVAAGGFQPAMFMRLFMAGFFLAFSFFKFLDLRGFADSYRSYDLLARRWAAYGYIYPFLELGLGIGYLTAAAPLYVGIATVVIMGFSAIGVLRSVLDKQQIRCACLGTVFNLPMSTVTIVEDVAMVVMAGAMLV